MQAQQPGRRRLAAEHPGGEQQAPHDGERGSAPRPRCRWSGRRTRDLRHRSAPAGVHVGCGHDVPTLDRTRRGGARRTRRRSTSRRRWGSRCASRSSSAPSDSPSSSLARFVDSLVVRDDVFVVRSRCSPVCALADGLVVVPGHHAAERHGHDDAERGRGPPGAPGAGPARPGPAGLGADGTAMGCSLSRIGAPDGTKGGPRRRERRVRTLQEPNGAVAVPAVRGPARRLSAALRSRTREAVKAPKLAGNGPPVDRAGVGDLLDGYRPDRRVGRDVRGRRRAALALPVAAPGARHARRVTTSRSAAPPATAPSATRASPSRMSGEERPFPLDLVPRIIDAEEWAVVEAGVRQRVLALERFLADVYGPGEILADGVVPRRLVAELVALPPLRRRARSRRRRARPRGRRRPRARRRRALPRARGQPAHAVGHLVRGREPPGDDPRVPRAVRQPPHPARRRLPAAAARGAPGHRAARGRRPVRRRAHARHPQLRVLRALVPRPADGRRAGRGPRPRLPRPARLHAHHRRASSASTSCTGASTTSSSTRCTSGPSRCSAAPASSTRRAPAT